MEFGSKNADNTKEFAKNMAEEISEEEKETPGALFISLSGDLGAGKTTFVQGFAQGLGIKENITSPTFVIFKMYSVPKGKHFRRMIHVDCYRIKNSQELKVIGFNDVARDNGNIVLIEWPERVSDIIPKGAININLDHISETQRRIEIK